MNASAEFQVNEDTIVNVQVQGNNLIPVFGAINTAGSQQWSSVALDANGDFTVSWTSYGQDITGGGPNNQGQNGIYARRFNSTAQMRVLNVGGQLVALGMTYAAADVFQVNSFAPGNQQHSHVAMDAAGDIVVAWESFEDVTAGATSYGIYARRYAPTLAVNYLPAVLINQNAPQPFKFIGTNGLYGPDGEIGNEFQVNATMAGNQRYPSVSINAAGDVTFVWSGAASRTPKACTCGPIIRLRTQPAP